MVFICCFESLDADVRDLDEGALDQPSTKVSVKTKTKDSSTKASFHTLIMLNPYVQNLIILVVKLACYVMLNHYLVLALVMTNSCI